MYATYNTIYKNIKEKSGKSRNIKAIIFFIIIEYSTGKGNLHLTFSSRQPITY